MQKLLAVQRQRLHHRAHTVFKVFVLFDCTGSSSIKLNDYNRTNNGFPFMSSFSKDFFSYFLKGDFP